jgi:ArsR family metal-binding transcriptional regulator
MNGSVIFLEQTHGPVICVHCDKPTGRSIDYIKTYGNAHYKCDSCGVDQCYSLAFKRLTNEEIQQAERILQDRGVLSGHSRQSREEKILSIEL